MKIWFAVLALLVLTAPAFADSTAGGGAVMTEPGVIRKSMTKATGTEAALTINYDVNKATSGDDIAILINQTDTNSPGVSYWIRGIWNGSGKFYISNLGSALFNSVVGADYFVSQRASTGSASPFNHTGTLSSWGSIYKASSVIGAMNGSDTLNVFDYAATTGNHTGYDNKIRIFNAGNITGDAQATETAIALGTGYDYLLDSDVAVIEANGHVSTDGVAPTLSSCGSGPAAAVGSSDHAGTVTIGTGVTTACTVAFAAAYGFTPACTITPHYNAGAVYVSAIDQAGFTVTFGNDGASQKFSYACTGLAEASYFLPVGDSRSTVTVSPYNTWQDELQTSLRAAGSAYRMATPIATGGWGVDEWTTDGAIDTALAAYPLSSRSVKWVLLNIGINDVGHAPSESDFKADYAYILDALHVRFPYAQVLCSKFWSQSLKASVGTYNTYAAAVVADGRTAWAAMGDDETAWLEGGDDGATMTSDGVHFSAAGNTAKAAAVKAAMGL